MISAEDFNAWRDNHVTEAVFKALRIKAGEAKASWLSHSWSSGEISPELLADLRARAEIANDICELTHEELEKIIEPERYQSDRIQGADQAQGG